jgi:hypothetical protein
MIAIKSILKDERINAYNVLIEISISEYLKFARNVIDNNEFQRKKVIKSKIKEILKDDLLRNCLIPSIVLAVSNDNIKAIKDENDTQSSEVIINKAIDSNEILIIDGLQRTYVLLSLEEELHKKGDEDALQKLYNHKIRAEVYLGLNRIGLLYRMITLNTGQTTMSTRHLMEILYLDYARIGVNGIKLIKDKEEAQISLNTDEFNFKTILDGFNSYLEKNEGLIERTEILDNIKSLDVIKDEEINKDLFKDFLLTYKVMLDQLVLKTNSWKYNTDNIEEQALKLNTNAFGKSILDIFKKSQVLTGFGAAIGHLKETKNLSLIDIETKLMLITAENDDWNTALCHLLKQLDLVKEKSKKIGNDQRYFFKFFFRSLLNPDSDQYLNFNKSSDFAFNRTREDKF